MYGDANVPGLTPRDVRRMLDDFAVDLMLNSKVSATLLTTEGKELCDTNGNELMAYKILSSGNELLAYRK